MGAIKPQSPGALTSRGMAREFDVRTGGGSRTARFDEKTRPDAGMGDGAGGRPADGPVLIVASRGSYWTRPMAFLLETEPEPPETPT